MAEAIVILRKGDAFGGRVCSIPCVEVETCSPVKIPYLIAHPGAHVGAGGEAGIKTIARSLDDSHAACKGSRVRVALEITAGQGSNLGYRFDQIRKMIDATQESDRLKVCFDTEHAFAAGKDAREDNGRRSAV